MEKTLKAVANRRRLGIVKYLKKEGEASVGNIAHSINLSFKATARHLAVLFAAGVLEKDQRSSFMFYRLAQNQSDISKSIIKFI